MGRFTKKIVIFYSVLLACWLPLSVAASSLDCLFHNDSPSMTMTNSMENSVHDSFVDLSDLEFSMSMEEHETQDASCSTQLIFAAVAENKNTDDGFIAQHYVKDQETYRLTQVLLPRDIRPPISV